MYGSGQQVIDFAPGQIRGEIHTDLIAGGVEYVIHVPISSDAPSEENNYADGAGVSPTYFEHYDEQTTQGEGAEQRGFGRVNLDEIAVDSQWRRCDAEAGRYDEQVLPVETDFDGESATFGRDEHPRPDIDAATLVASEAAREERSWYPTARTVDSHEVGADPVTILTGPIPATKDILEQNDMTVDDIDRFEVNEAIASVIGA